MRNEEMKKLKLFFPFNYATLTPKKKLHLPLQTPQLKANKFIILFDKVKIKKK